VFVIKPNNIILNWRKLFSAQRLTVAIFALYLAAGLFIVKDYGISIDEMTEWKTGMINYVYVMGDTMRTSQNETVRYNAEIVPELETWYDRFYGVALPSVTLFIEHMRGFSMAWREVLIMRHIFTFLNYFIAGIFFYLILRRRYGNTFIPVIGAIMYILYPRFFGEAFYNIKDILFYSWNIISVYFVLRWLESRRNGFFIGAAMVLAVTTNVRILGISLLLLTVAFAVISDSAKGQKPWQIIKRPLLLTVASFIFYVIITPFLWEHPIKNAIDTFLHFIRFEPWDDTHLYLGEMITTQVPWHYIPVWMGITIPILYIAMFSVGVPAAVSAGIGFLREKIQILKQRRRENNEDARITPVAQLYDAFFTALFFATLLGFIILRINMYEGWRHAYSVFFPFLYIAVYGMDRLARFISHKRRAVRYGFVCAVTVCLCAQFAWIVINHPYQYVYFNALGRPFAEKNFALDYWEVSCADLIRFALRNDDRPVITVYGGYASVKQLILTQEENTRLVFADDIETADYYIGHTRKPYENRVAPSGFEEIAAITVDGMKIATIYKRA